MKYVLLFSSWQVLMDIHHFDIWTMWRCSAMMDLGILISKFQMCQMMMMSIWFGNWENMAYCSSTWGMFSVHKYELNAHWMTMIHIIWCTAVAHGGMFNVDININRAPAGCSSIPIGRSTHELSCTYTISNTISCTISCSNTISCWEVLSGNAPMQLVCEF